MITRKLEALIHRTSRKGGVSEDFQEEGKYIKSTIYGGLDGIITTFAVVAGVAGASLPSGVVLILGIANLIADGLSMAIGDYLSTQAEQEYASSKRKDVEKLVNQDPDRQQRATVDIYVEKGIDEEDAEILGNIFSRYKAAWVDTLMAESHGILEERESPLMNATVTFLSFCLFGVMPLLSYIIAWYVPALSSHTFGLACVATALTLFLLGAQKIRFTNRHWFFSGIEMLSIGGIAALVAYGIGVLLSGVA